MHQRKIIAFIEPHNDEPKIDDCEVDSALEQFSTSCNKNEYNDVLLLINLNEAETSKNSRTQESNYSENEISFSQHDIVIDESLPLNKKVMFYF